MTEHDPGWQRDSVQLFRRRALAVVAATLAVGMAALIVVLAIAVPAATTLDLLMLGVSVVAHGVVALTVGRRWEPGGAVNVLYVLFAAGLVLVGVSYAPSPASDVVWFLLAPITLAAITLSRQWLAAVTVFGLLGYLAASSIGPGVDAAYAAQRGTALIVFAIGMGAIGSRLHHALREADAAQVALRADVVDVTSENVELQRVDTAREDYVAIVSHELRTPLTVILGLARTLDRRWDELTATERRRMANRVAISARSIDGIVSALLDLARIDRGGVHPVVGPVALDEAVEDSLLRLEELLADHDVACDVAAGTEVLTDGRLLQRVLDNLLTNAARHTPAGTLVEVVARPRGQRVRVEVRDSGGGIAPDDVARLGEQFFRAGGVPHTDGLGLGLALVVEVLHTLGEELEVDSELGRGTSFAFSLPRAEADGS